MVRTGTLGRERAPAVRARRGCPSAVAALHEKS